MSSHLCKLILSHTSCASTYSLAERAIPVWFLDLLVWEIIVVILQTLMTVTSLASINKSVYFTSLSMQFVVDWSYTCSIVCFYIVYQNTSLIASFRRSWPLTIFTLWYKLFWKSLLALVTKRKFILILISVLLLNLALSRMICNFISELSYDIECVVVNPHRRNLSRWIEKQFEILFLVFLNN